MEAALQKLLSVFERKHAWFFQTSQETVRDYLDEESFPEFKEGRKLPNALHSELSYRVRQLVDKKKRLFVKESRLGRPKRTKV